MMTPCQFITGEIHERGISDQQTDDHQTDMSIASFMHGGEGELVREIDTGPPMNAHIKVFEIDEPDFVGVQYGPQDKQAQPRSWWRGRIPEKVFAAKPLFTLQPRKRS